MKDLIRRGQKARAAGRWTEAYEAYKAAFEATDPASSPVAERAELVGELGLCALALRKYREAAEHLTQSLERRELLPIQLQQRFEVGQAKAAFYVGTLLLAVDPPDAEVLIDGKPVARAARSYKVFLEPGRHMVRARAPGREEALHSFSAVAGVEHEMSMQLPRAAAQAAPKALSSPPPVRPPPPGPWASWPGALRITGIGLTAATASLGAIFMVRASVANGDLDERNKALDAAGVTPWVCREVPKPPVCSELTRLRRERDLFAGLGTAMVVTSGVVGAATMASFFTDFAFVRDRPTETRIGLSPTVTPVEAGLVAYGVW
ncbi:tetratricopeptide repeat protein [Sorangium sp. So ce1151]|uniref:tetratricopeptide repeat protein n=1 Tax=Sorangium sp. So ce1151 TaxID=3133332 RepID=UPI003F64900F